MTETTKQTSSQLEPSTVHYSALTHILVKGFIFPDHISLVCVTEIPVQRMLEFTCTPDWSRGSRLKQETVKCEVHGAAVSCCKWFEPLFTQARLKATQCGALKAPLCSRWKSLCGSETTALTPCRVFLATAGTSFFFFAWVAPSASAWALNSPVKAPSASSAGLKPRGDSGSFWFSERPLLFVFQ